MNSLFDTLTSQDSTLEERKNAILTLTETRLKQMIKTEDIPEELEYIVVEVAIKRYNRLSNEGMASYSQDGLNITFNDDDFKEFKQDIDDWLTENDKKQRTKYKVRFL